MDFKNKKVIEKPFTSNINKTKIEKITKFRIVMINSNFDLGYKIDREELYLITKKKTFQLFMNQLNMLV